MGSRPLRTISASLVVAAAVVGGPPVAGAAGSIRLSAPQRVEVGQVVRVALDVARPARVGAFEAVARLDRRRARLLAVEGRSGGPGSPVALGPVRSGRLVAFGSYACGPGCAPAVERRAASGRRLATLELRARRPGRLRLTVVRATTADMEGLRVATSDGASTIVLRVGRRGSGRRRASERVPLSRRWRARRPRPLDVTGDGAVGPDDVAELTLAWTRARERGDRCATPTRGAHDINRDGCLDAIDLQRVAARVAKPVAPPPIPGSPAPSPSPPSETTPTPGPRPGFVVDVASDAPDAAIDGRCVTASGGCSLRAAIQEANVRSGPDTITFRLTGDGVHTIRLQAALPALNDATGPITIDGLSQRGATPNEDPLAFDARLAVEVAGAGEPAFDCLTVLSPGNVIRGLAIYRCRRSVLLLGPGAHDNRLVSNHLGTDAAGTFAAPPSVGAGAGVELRQGAAANDIGAPGPSGRNVISGSSGTGVQMYDQGTDRNRLRNNVIGLSPGGGARLANRAHGIDLNSGPAHNVIGGTAAGDGNVISGNGVHEDKSNFTAGIEISHGTATTGNRILGNRFGTDLAGTSAPAYASNGDYGIRLEDGVNDVDVVGNVVANNRSGGIKVDGTTTHAIRIAGNRIGVSASGAPSANAVFGVLVAAGATGVRIGPGNIVAHNAVGIRLVHPTTDGNPVTRNAISANDGLGIDLDPGPGVTPNDAQDADSGSNEQLNFPVIAAASPTTVAGFACTGCTVEAFVADGDRSGHGEGSEFVGAAVAGADGAFSIPATLAAGTSVTATATDAHGNTSEFAANVPVRGEPARVVRGSRRARRRSEPQAVGLGQLPCVPPPQASRSRSFACADSSFARESSWNARSFARLSCSCHSGASEKRRRVPTSYVSVVRSQLPR